VIRVKEREKKRGLRGVKGSGAEEGPVGK